MAGSSVSWTSPHVTSKSAESSQNSNDTDPVPRARQGVGPSSVSRRRMLNTPTPPAFSETDADASITKYSGEKRSSASKPRWPSTLNASKPK